MPGRKEQESRMGRSPRRKPINRQLIRLLELGLGLCASFVLCPLACKKALVSFHNHHCAMVGRFSTLFPGRVNVYASQHGARTMQKTRRKLKKKHLYRLFGLGAGFPHGVPS